MALSTNFVTKAIRGLRCIQAQLLRMGTVEVPMDTLGFSDARWSAKGARSDRARQALRRRVPRLAACVLGVCAAMCQAAAPGDSAEPAAAMQSPACQHARAALETALDASARDRTQNAAALNKARKEAAEACLGRAATPAPTVRAIPPAPVAVPPVRAAAPAAIGTPSGATAPLPPVEVQRPSVINSCDATGCWDNQGNRLQQVGPMLSGPRGACSVQGSFVSCP